MQAEHAGESLCLHILFVLQTLLSFTNLNFTFSLKAVTFFTGRSVKVCRQGGSNGNGNNGSKSNRMKEKAGETDIGLAKGE